MDTATVHPLRWEKARIPARNRGLRWEHYKPVSDEAAHALTRTRAFVEEINDHYIRPQRPLEDYPADRTQIGRGLLLGGLPGSGKTMLASIALQELSLQHGIKVFFATMPEYFSAMLELRDLQKQADDGDPEAREAYWAIGRFLLAIRRAPVVCLDDVGKEHKTATRFAQDEFDRLLRSRHDAGRPTMITTNKAIQEWKIYHDSMPSFVQEAFEVVRFGREDRRLQAA